MIKMIPNLNFNAKYLKTLEAYNKKGKLNEVLNKIGEVLGERSRDIACMRIGYGYDRYYTLRQVGDKYSISTERVRQIEGKIDRRMRHIAIQRSILNIN